MKPSCGGWPRRTTRSALSDPDATLERAATWHAPDVGMPARPYDPARATVYLDWSTLVYAFNSRVLPSCDVGTGLAGLFALVEEIASDANLVFSQLHLSELAAWDDIAAAREAAAWLDGLPLVWARFWPHVQESEDKHWVKAVVGCSSVDPVQVFAPSMLATLEALPAGDMAEVLRTPTLAALFELERTGGGFTAAIARDALKWAEMFHHNRRVVEREATPAEMAAYKETTAYRQRVLLRQRALAAHQRLMASDTEYATKRPSLNDVIDPFVSAFENNPVALPLAKVFDRLADGFISTAARRTPESRGFGKLDSSVVDIFHALTGAAYCSIFTCDQLTASWLGDVRSKLGLSQPVVFSKDEARFVAELRRAWGALQ